ncbi:glycoside hydrolase family 61 protein [Laccaria bicolor S238N-H82]|uniref:lytic cellulose monooxygenase (C4-dehydrogenating) n=1 Tax=Laccaria bicolor (strain S238N-H82 / ATCC MYA-4686) TaxID=486041 RepID=B0CZ36_LACBS|nr:glycoside hydrolase family 61 protein [Laccaria bicolor S238N-H82]EDR12995.1 glycoside hydrolase family 61 protein [Laccaria bicolor S238N-H82]|eukprot:XP_001877259.1 glycoside hydrolase family 61 protein [Laccaria bicolor S238N-H82]
MYVVLLALMSDSLTSVLVTSNLAPRNYFVRHEIMALHLATSLGGAAFYPTCSRLTVGALGTGVPEPSGLFSLPGAYSDNDSGIFYSQMFDASAP